MKYTFFHQKYDNSMNIGLSNPYCGLQTPNMGPKPQNEDQKP